LGLVLAGTAGLSHPKAASLPSDDKAIVHVLNRTGFGPRPGDVAKVRETGLQAYVELQLHPERIADPLVAARLADLTTVSMTLADISNEFEIPQILARRDRLRAGQSGQGGQPQPTPEMRQRANQPIVELSEHKLLRAIYSERQLQEVLTDFWFNHFNIDARKGRARFMLTDYERDVIRPRVLGRFRDLLEATAKSPAMLFYLDNWLSADPDGPHPEVGRIVRPDFGRRAFGGRGIMPRQPGSQNGQGNRQPRGLNENYGRELMELHTLGVDGGYTQKDVTEVARCFTGWTIAPPRLGSGFRFEPRIHDPGEKTVLGHRIKAGGGQSDGEQVLDLLARHPSTARFIATKLVRRFVSDTPPTSLVERAAERFRRTDGDIREVMQTILTSPEFFAPEVYRAKVKTPFEFVVSALRATAADAEDAVPLVRAMQQLGMPLYLCQPPTGYKDTADAWVNAGALVNRMNFALALSSDRLPGISINRAMAFGSDAPSPDLRAARGRLIEAILGNDASESTREKITKATGVPEIAALTLGAPEFQRR
jgi:uncharacterized protein (DUF1800 family)